PWLKIAATLLAATSMYFVFNLVFNNLLQTPLPPLLVGIIAATASLIIVQFTDNKLVYMMYFGFKLFLQVFSKGFWKQGWKSLAAVIAAIIVFGLALGRLGLTSTLTFFTKDEIAANVIQTPDDEGLSELQLTKEKNKMATIERVEKSLAEAKKTQRKRVKQAEKQGNAKIAAVLKNGSPSWRKDWKRQNHWFMNTMQGAKYAKAVQWREQMKAATAEAAELIAAEEAVADDLQATLTAMLVPSNDSNDPTLAALSGLVQTKTGLYQNRTQNVSHFTVIADVALGVAVLLFIALMALAAFLTGKDVLEEEQEDQSLLNVLQSAAASTWHYTVEQLKRVGLDLGTKQQKVQIAGTNTSVLFSPTVYRSDGKEGNIVLDAEQKNIAFIENTEQKEQSAHNRTNPNTEQQTEQNTRNSVPPVENRSVPQNKNKAPLPTLWQHGFELKEGTAYFHYTNPKSSRRTEKKLSGSSGVLDSLRTYRTRLSAAEQKRAEQIANNGTVENGTQNSVARNKAWISLLTHAEQEMRNMEKLGHIYEAQQYTEQ
ncbi:MAG: hypothetical protein AAF599_03275, partial [Bacteroidota bacterium]